MSRRPSKARFASRILGQEGRCNRGCGVVSRARSSFRGIQAFRGRRKIALAPSPARRCEAYNVEVVRCDNFVTPNSLKSHAGRKLLSPLVQYPCRNAQVVHAFGLKSSRPEITHSLKSRRTIGAISPAVSLGGLRTPAPECVAPSSWAGIRKPSHFRTSARATAMSASPR